MVNASKILTVSYGTFSCTLEGFDDPFSTMRSIAEYFRDLAADDRYFGAEPPTPDAEMLHQIAEREINRRVEARVQDNGVVLRQIEDDGDGDRTARATAERQRASAKPAAKKPAAEKPAVATSAVAASAATAAASQPFDTESVADKLARIRAAVSRAQNEPQLGSVFPEDEHAETITPDVQVEEAFADSEALRAGTGDATDLMEPGEATEDDGYEEDLAGPAAGIDIGVQESLAEALAAPDAETESPDGDTDAEAEAEADDAPVADMAGSADATSEADETEDDVSVSEDATADDADPQTEMADEAAEDDQTAEVEVAETEAETEAEAEAEETAEDETTVDAAAEAEAEPETETAEATPDVQDEDLDLSSIMGDADAEADTAPDKLVLGASQRVLETEDDGDGDLDLSDMLGADSHAADDGETPDTATDAAKAEDTELKGPRVRVMKMSREEFEDRFVEAEDDEAGDEEEAVAEDGPEDIREALGETGLSEEDEADLVNELLAVERDAQSDRDDEEPGEDRNAPDVAAAEISPDEDDGDEDGEDGDELATADDTPDDDGDAEDAPDEDKAKAAADLAAMVSAVSGEEPKGGDVSVDRLLAQADSELENQEGSRRRSAIAHLKAAVAAVRADGGKVEKETDAEEARNLDKFRNDLASVVRPEKPDAPADKAPVTPRPAPVLASPDTTGDAAEAAPVRARRRMPPLMLVSEQRVDKPDPSDAPSAPVRPRRVQSSDIDDEDGNELFEDSLAGDAEGAAGNMFSDDGKFSRYVADNAAEGLQELLEASAAFSAHVEGAAMNTRPQIMHRVVRFLPKEEFTREEGLRAFGVLLREGRIRRVERGQFTIAPSSRFKAEKQSATG